MTREFVRTSAFPGQRRMLRALVLGTTALLSFTPALVAQQFGNIAQKQTADAVKSLSAESQQVLERLGKLNSIPVEEWRYHTGDVPDGQSPTLDDSSWTPAKLRCARRPRM